MKIIETDNLGRDYPDEKVVADNIPYQRFAEIMCEALVSHLCNDRAARWYKVVEDNYELQGGFEP